MHQWNSKNIEWNKYFLSPEVNALTNRGEHQYATDEEKWRGIQRRYNVLSPEFTERGGLKKKKKLHLENAKSYSGNGAK